MLRFAQVASGQLAQITLAPLWHDEGLPLAIMGMLVVFVVLVLISSVITLLPRLISLLERLQPEKVEPVMAAAKPRNPDAVPEEILVVIAAAAAEVMGTPHRIVRIRGLTPGDLDWALKGRIQHHSSHRITRRDAH